MNTESKVPSVEMCRKLWDAGLRLETERVWMLAPPEMMEMNGEGDSWSVVGVTAWDLRNGSDSPLVGAQYNLAAKEDEGSQWFPAPDLAELLLVMPQQRIAAKPDRLAEILLGNINAGFEIPELVNERTKGQP